MHMSLHGTWQGTSGVPDLFSFIARPRSLVRCLTIHSSPTSEIKFCFMKCWAISGERSMMKGPRRMFLEGYLCLLWVVWALWVCRGALGMQRVWALLVVLGRSAI